MPLSLVNLIYLLSASLFIIGLRGLAHPRTAVRGNMLGAIGMLLAVVVTLLDRQILGYEVIAAGLVIGSLLGTVLALRIKMTAMPQLVGMFNGFGGYIPPTEHCHSSIRIDRCSDFLGLSRCICKTPGHRNGKAREVQG
jgi:NAD/NADP transhydrogenase beta subunit